MSENIAPQPIPVIEDINTEMSDEDLKRHLQIEIVDQSHGVQTAAQDHAAEFINRKTTEGGRVKRFIRKVWHGNLARDYYTLREQRKGIEQTVESGNVHHLQGGDEAAHAESSAAVIDRVSQDWLLSGETRDQVAEIDGGGKLETELKNLVKKYASDDKMTRDALVEAKTRLMHEFGKGRRDTDRNKGLLLADNIVEVADSAKIALRCNIGMDRIDAALSAHHTEVKMGAQTELRAAGAEKLANALYKTRIGSMVNETTVAALASVPFILGKVVTRKAAVAAGAVVAMGAGSALVAGVRESYHMKKDRQTHLREMATGGGDTLAHAGKRREKLAKTQYKTYEASELIHELDASSEQAGESSDSLRIAIDKLVLASTLQTESDKRSIDLVTFSGKTSVETERFDLMLKTAEAKVAVKHAFENASQDALDELNVPAGTNFNSVLAIRTAKVLESIDANISERDKAFNSLRNKQVLKAAATGFVTSAVIGLAVQEGKAFFSDSLQGAFESGTGERRTLLAGLFKDDAQVEVTPTSGSTDTTDVESLMRVPHDGKVYVPDGYSLEKGEGAWNLVDSNGNVVNDNIQIGERGGMTVESRNALKAQGFEFNIHEKVVDDPDTIEYTTVERSVGEYMDHHQKDFTSVHRELWYDNDTTAIYDKNELRLTWGAEGTGINENGDYVLNIGTMTSDGSYHAGLSADAQQLAQDHRIKIALSATEATQDRVVMVSVNEDGIAVIDKDSFAGRNLLAREDGHAKLLGRYAEADVLGEKHNGVQSVSMLATATGEGNIDTITDKVGHTVENSHRVVTTHVIAPELAPESIAVDSDIEIPGAIPIRARKGLEYAQNSNEDPGYYGYKYGYGSPEEFKKKLKELTESPWVSKEIIDSPESRLDQAKELAGYRDRVTKSADSKIISDIEKAIADDPVLANLGSKGDMRALVTIPVYGGGEQDNIYRTLSLYAQQDEQTKRSTPILLHVNYPDGDLKDPSKRLNVEKTMAEIERARRDFPDLEVATFKSEWPQEWYDWMKDANGGVIQPAVERLYDVALFAIDKGIREGRISPDEDVVIVRNDSDSLGMSNNYLGRMIDSADKHRETDVFSAPSRWETRKHGDYPGFGVASNTREIMNVLTSKRSVNGRVQTIGMNMAIRASALAAIGGIRRPSGDVWSGAGTDDLEIGSRIYALRIDRQLVERAYEKSYEQTGRVGRLSGRYRAERAAYAAAYALTNSGSLPDSTARPIEFVHGAQIDTLGDRLLKQYRRGRPFVRAWDRFGNERRDQVGKNDTLMGPETDGTPGQVLDRVEFQLNGMFNEWFRNPGQVRLGLNLQFGEKTPSGDKIYTLRYDPNGKCTFAFTDEGRKHVAKRLNISGRGRHGETFGTRMARNLYGKTTPGGKRFTRARAPLVAGQS